MDGVRYRVIVAGRVQGVYFRDTCQRTAREFGVHGWVRNRADGTVEVAAEGTRDAVDRLVEWCRTGPPRADVTSLEISAEAPTGERGFRVVG